MSSDRSLRSSQLVSPYGPGAIVDIGDESLLLTDLSDWPKKLRSIEMPRLTSELRVRTLKAPPESPEFGKTEKWNMIKTVRFPRWMFCPNCRQLEEWKNDRGELRDGKPVCKNPGCKKRALVPMRFVAACEQGHLSDVPWNYWAHYGVPEDKRCKQKEARLYFKSDNSRGSGLDALYIECKNKKCGGSRRHLGDITTPDALKFKCNGSQPWEWNEEKVTCESPLVVLQRGASNLYYPVVRSALDIPGNPQQSSALIEDIKLHPQFSIFQTMVDKGNKIVAEGIAEVIAEDLDCGIDEVFSAAGGGTAESDTGSAPDYSTLQNELQDEEWKVLSDANVAGKSDKNFLARVVKQTITPDWSLNPLIKRVVLLDKLREVRVFCGFERVKPGVSIVPPSGQHKDIKWLPAIEVFGEGIFIELDQKALKEWEQKSSGFIKGRISPMNKRYAESNVSYLPEPCSSLVLLHTFAHLLIRQLSFECGYSSGSIRERIYAREGQAGILIYTADSDSEGSLGGLVQQGEPNRLYPVIAAALEQASWCSNDPVCSEMEMQGVMGLNKAACHSCTLVSETSCTMNNLLLDRKLLLGDEQGNGFFTNVLNEIRESR